MLELLDVVFVKDVGNHILIKIIIRVKLNNLLLFLVEEHHEDVEATKHGQLNHLLEKASLSLGDCHLPLIVVLDVLQIVLRFHSNLSYWLLLIAFNFINQINC